MSFGVVLTLAVGLSMDAMAVAAARGLALRQVRLRHLLLIAGFRYWARHSCFRS